MKIGNLEVYGIIYLIRNKINNKVYIGQTIHKRGFNGRYKDNVEKNTHNAYLKRSIHKYGIHNFHISKMIDLAFSKEELNIKEITWISYYDSYNTGYNQTLGGDSSSGYIMSESAKDKIRIFNLGKLLSDEHKNKISNSLLGHTVTSETKIKLKEFNLGKNNPSYSKESVRRRKTICTTTFKIFDCMKDASEEHKILINHISDCCKGKRKSCGKLDDGTKLRWMYYEDYIKQNQLLIHNENLGQAI